MSRRGVALIIWFLLIPTGYTGSSAASDEILPRETAFASVKAGVPVVEVPEPFYNFGELQEGMDYTHVFLIRNTGNGVLEIKKVLPG